MKITELRVLGDSGKEYVITLRGTEAVCSCPAFMYYEGPCKHMRFVAENFQPAPALAQ